jgi:pyruvate/2-oxoglutarate/acetoin dehydrogenase E1 component
MKELMYKAELVRAMDYIGQLPKSLFVGQAVRVPGTAMSGTLENIDKSKLIEFPVEEDLQMGYTIGLAMNGFLPVSIFPRWNFLVLATNQIVNHLDKLKEMMGVETPPKVIIRTGIGAKNPMHPGPQHTGDYTEAFKLMAPNLEIIRLDEPEEIFSTYKKAADRTDGVSSLIIEWGDFYGSK